MKFLKIWAAVALLCGVSAVSFYGGREYEAYYYNIDNLFEVHQELRALNTKNYEAACLEADFIRYLRDHFEGETECANIGAEIEECYYEFFEGLESGTFKTDKVKSIKDLQQYCWCYGY